MKKYTDKKAPQDRLASAIIERIGDAITNSAKTKFDYPAFEAAFCDYPKLKADNILFQIITKLADGETKASIAAHFEQELWSLGLGFEGAFWKTFLEHNRTQNARTRGESCCGI